ncbi:MAG: hypothetical protein IPL41_14855 [Micropruina sp.]|nr:hypothetical protein [Micropruina sp.]
MLTRFILACRDLRRVPGFGRRRDQVGRHDGTGRVNCGRCEKCLRTAGGLLLAGIDPTVVGLPIQPDA